MSEQDHSDDLGPPHQSETSPAARPGTSAGEANRASEASRAAGPYGGPPWLATRGERFVGFLIDAIAQAVVMAPLYFIIVLAAGLGDALTTTFALQLFTTVLFVIVFLAIQGYLLATRGQTVGKLLIKTRIVDRETEQLVPIGPLIAKRYAWLWLCGLIPYVYQFAFTVFLIDALLVFRSSRACLHDDIAKTKVIKIV